MEYTKIQQLSGLMVAFDFEKAFDSLSWSSYLEPCDLLTSVNHLFVGLVV